MSERFRFGGVPTGPDVQKLIDAFGTPEPGLITYDALALACGLDSRSTRFRTVVTRWRKKLLSEQNVYTAADPGKGVAVLNEHERTEAIEHLQGRASRSQRRVLFHAIRIKLESCDTVYQQRVNHLRIQAAKAAGVVSDASRAVRAFAVFPQKQQPRLNGPAK